MNEYEINNAIQELLKPKVKLQKESLREIFERRLVEIDLPKTRAAELCEMQLRTLEGILDGTLQRIDISNLIKISSFLQIPFSQVIELFGETISSKLPPSNQPTSQSIEFIKENFDLAILKKAGIIDTVKDFVRIQQQLLEYLDIDNILNYKRPPMDVAFSSGIISPKNDLTRDLWIAKGIRTFEKIKNPYLYSREALIKYFPEIRWHSTSVEIGLINVIQSLYKIGVTVVYQPKIKNDVHLRGAVLNVYNKPCIILTDYTGFYPSLFFALVHELFHVLFDWEEIQKNEYHTSANSDQLSVSEKELEANNFAREYLFSVNKTVEIKDRLRDEKFVELFAKNNNVHKSFIYVFNARDDNSKGAYILAQKHNPKFEYTKLLNKLTEATKKEIDRKIYN